MSLDFVIHPDSVWDKTKGMDYISWDGVQELSLVKRAEESSAEYSENLPREAFLGLFNAANSLTENSPKNLDVVHSLLERAQRMPEFQDLRRSVAGDACASAAGSSTFVYEFLNKLPEDLKKSLKEQQEAQGQQQDISNQLSALQEMMAAAGGQNGAPDGKGGQQQGQGGSGTSGGTGPQMTQDMLEQALQAAQERLDKANQNLQESLGKSKHQVENNMAKAMRNAENTLKDMKDNQRMLGWGLGDGNGQLTKQGVEDLLKLGSLLKSSRYLKRVIEMLGWANRLMKSELKNKVRGREELVDYRRQELDLDTMAPEEWVALASPQDSPLYLDWLVRAVDKGVLHMHYEAQEPKGKGPCIIVKDTSGSTMGDPFATETALEYVIMQQMIKDRRRFVSIPFSDTGQYEVYDPGPKPNVDKLIEHLGFGYWKGTEPYAPLTKALDIIETDPSFKEGCILIITDGSFSDPTPEFLARLNKARKKPGVKLIAVVINAHPGAATFADMVITLKDLFAQRDELAPALAQIL